MSRWRPEYVVVGIGAQGVAWGNDTGAVALRPLRLSTDAGTHLSETTQLPGDELRSVLEEIKTTWPRGRMRIVLADSVVRYWMTVPPANVSSLRELQAVAAVRCTQLHGGETSAWNVIGDWRIDRPFLCAAMPQWLCETLDRSTLKRPRVAAALTLLLRTNVPLADDGWVCVTAPEGCALLGISQGHLDSVRTISIARGADKIERLSQAATELLRQSLRTQRPLVAPVAWLDLAGLPKGDSRVGAIEFTSLDLNGLPAATATCASLNEAAVAVSLGMSARVWS